MTEGTGVAAHGVWQPLRGFAIFIFVESKDRETDKRLPGVTCRDALSSRDPLRPDPFCSDPFCP